MQLVTLKTCFSTLLLYRHSTLTPVCCAFLLLLLQLYALSATASVAATPADPTSLKLQLLMPRAGLLATPLYTKRLCHVPLAEAMLKPGCMPTGQTGYLSMDQARSLLPLEATDANVSVLGEAYIPHTYLSIFKHDIC